MTGVYALTGDQTMSCQTYSIIECVGYTYHMRQSPCCHELV